MSAGLMRKVEGGLGKSRDEEKKEVQGNLVDGEKMTMQSDKGNGVWL